MRIKFLLLFLVLSFAPSGFALDTHFESAEETKFANELFTQKEKDWPNIWTFDFLKDVTYVQGFSKLSDVKVSSVFTVPHFKFYKSADLTGEVFAQIDDKGLKIGDKYTCAVEKVDEKNFTLTQEKRWDSKDEDTVYEIRDPIRDGSVLKYLISCKDFFIYPIPTGGEHHYFHPGMKLEIINHKIGKVKMRGVDVYFDATAWISTYSAKTDALTTLKKILTQDDFDQIYELMKKLRKLIETEDKEGLFTFVTRKKIESMKNPGGYIDIKSYFNIRKDDFLSYKFEKKSELLKKTTFIYKKDVSAQEIGWGPILYLSVRGNNSGDYIRFLKKEKKWSVVNFFLKNH